MANLSNINNKLIVTDGGNLLVNATANLATYGGITIDNFSDPSIAMKTTGTSGWLWTQYITSTGTNNFSMGVNQTAPYWCVKAGAGMDSPHLVVDSAGEVGIGTTGPLTKLDVRGSTFVSGYLAGFDTTPQGNYAYRLTNDGANSFINVLGGNLGIGTTSPDFALDIEAVSSGVQLQIGRTVTSAGSTWMGSDSNGFHLGVGAYGAGNSVSDPNGFSVDTSGNVGIGTTSPSFQLSIENHATTTSTATMELDGKRTNGTDGSVGEMIFSNNGDTFATVAGFRDGADNKGSLQFQTQDSTFATRMTISSEGNVGIGTTNPTCPIDFGTSVANDKRIIGTYVTGNLFTGIGMSATTAGLRIAGDFSANNLLDIGYYSTDGNYTWSSTMFINNTNVGIGTTSPAAKLDVVVPNSGGAARQDMFRLLQSGQNTLSCYMYGGTTDLVQLHVSGAEQHLSLTTGGVATATTDTGIHLRSGGNVGIGTISPTYKLQVAGTTLISGGLKVIGPGSYNTFQSGNDYTLGLNDYNSVSQWWLKAYTTGDFALHENTQGDRFTIKAGGNVGIGTASPTAKLDIAGDVRYRGNTYNQLTYQVTGNYSANTWYTAATSATLTESGIYILVVYLNEFSAGGGNYYVHAASTNFYWDTTSTNRVTAFNFPPLLGTGHATGNIPLIRITQEMGSSGAQSKIQWQNSYTYTNLTANLSGKQFTLYFKKIGG